MNWRNRTKEPRLAIKENGNISTKLINSSPERDSEKSYISSSSTKETLFNRTERLHTSTYSTASRFPLNNDIQENEFEENNDSFDLTPPASRSGYYTLNSRSRSRSNTPLRLNTSLRSPCTARTRQGTPCKLSAAPGRDFCFRHQTGDSIMG